MKYQSKLNQSRQFNGTKVTVKEISAIKIDAEQQTVTLIKISNSSTFIRKYLNIYECELFPIETASMNYVIVGTDQDLSTKKLFALKGNTKLYFGNAIVIQMPKSFDDEKLQSTKLTVKEVEEKIQFKNSFDE